MSFGEGVKLQHKSCCGTKRFRLGVAEIQLLTGWRAGMAANLGAEGANPAKNLRFSSPGSRCLSGGEQKKSPGLALGPFSCCPIGQVVGHG